METKKAGVQNKTYKSAGKKKKKRNNRSCFRTGMAGAVSVKTFLPEAEFEPTTPASVTSVLHPGVTLCCPRCSPGI